MTNNYYLANRIKRIEYQREYRRRMKTLNINGMNKVKKKYKKKPVPKTEFIKRKIIIYFD